MNPRLKAALENVEYDDPVWVIGPTYVLSDAILQVDAQTTRLSPTRPVYQTTTGRSINLAAFPTDLSGAQIGTAIVLDTARHGITDKMRDMISVARNRRARVKHIEV